MSTWVRLGLVVLAGFVGSVRADGPRKLLLLSQGPDGHPPQTHEYAAGQRILHRLLTQASKLDVQVVHADEPWREGPELLAKADGAVLFLSEGARWAQAEPKRWAAFRELAKRGGGLSVIHWGMGSKEEKNVAGFVELFGGCHGGPTRKYQVATTYGSAPEPQHPAVTGIEAFPVRDEFYYKLRLADGVRPLWSVAIDKQPETVAWTFERKDGGRSFGFSGLHFHENWGLTEYRRLVVQGVLWTMREPIPRGGVVVKLNAAELKTDSK